MTQLLVRNQSPLAEGRRLATLRALDLLNTPPEAEFDAVVALAAQLLGCRNVMFNLLDRDRMWAKAAHAPAFVGFSCARDQTICDTTIRGDAPLIVEDASRDPRFAQLPMVMSGEVRFYAGMPIQAEDSRGERRTIGAICAFDTMPRTLAPAELAALRHVATLTEAVVAARIVARRSTATARLAERQARVLQRKEHVFRQAERIAEIGSWRLNLADDTVEWSDGVYRIHELPVGAAPSLDGALEFYPPHDRAQLTAKLAHTIETGEPFTIEVDFVTAKGQLRRVRSMAECEIVDSRPTALVGVFQDITERHALEQALRNSAERDELTGIGNRAAFNRTLAAAMAAATEDETPLVLALLDLDGFKAINDTLGHLAGDDVLKAIGKRLEQPWLRGSFAARLGGDEFALIITNPMLVRDRNFARRLEDALRVPVTANALTIATGGTVGAVELSADVRSPRDFIHRADTILYAAKRARIGERRQGMRANR